jgi:membrane fusion protein, copper/silver efflux system
MKKTAYVVVLAASAIVAFVLGASTSQLRGSPVHVEKRIHHYACPMHPTYTSPHAGRAPCCGMQYEPVYEDAALPSAGSKTAVPLGTVHVPRAARQMLGVRVSDVRRSGGKQTLRLFGRVAADERRVYSLNAGIDGTILDVAAVTTGSRVHRNQRLATYTAPDFLLAIQSYILALDGLERRRAASQEDAGQPAANPGAIISSTPAGLVINSGSSNFQQRLDRLQLLGMSAVQIEEIRRVRDVPPSITIVSPVEGVVLSRSVSAGRRFGRGDEWFRVADLSRVWIVVEMFGDDVQHARPGMDAHVTVPGERRSLTARVSEVPPQYDPDTRTRTVRLEVENHGDVLRPGMAVDVEIAAVFAPALVVPREAVIDSGLKRTVFVERGPGLYEPREVHTGPRRDDEIEIVSGLALGDRIVTSGTFLLDADSRIRLATAR